MLDEDEDSDDERLYIDEREEPPSPKRQKTSENQNISTDNISPESNTKPSKLFNVRNRSTELPPVNDNNLINANEGKPGITINDVACISDASNSNENEEYDILALLTENTFSVLTDFEQHLTVSVSNEVLRAEAQNNDPILRKVTAATDYQRSPGSHMNTPQDQRVPIPQNPFGVQNENILHMLSVPSMNADRQTGVMFAYSGPPPLNQRHNGVNTNFPTGWPVQNGHELQIYRDAFSRQYSSAPGEYSYNPQAANYNRSAPLPMNCPPGCHCRHEANMSAYPSNPQATHNSRISQNMTYYDQQLASTNSQLKSVTMTSSQISNKSFIVQDENIPRMPCACACSVNHSGRDMSYGPSPLNQTYDGVNTMANVRPVQNVHQPQIHAFNRQHGYNSASALYNEHAAKYNQRVHQLNMSAHPSNLQPTHNSQIAPNLYPMASTNPQLKSVSMTSCHNFSCNGYGQACSTHSRTKKYLHRDQNVWAFSERQQTNCLRIQSMRTEATYVASTSGHMNVSSGVKTKKQIAMNTNSEIPASSTYNNVIGSVAGLNLPNWHAFGTKETVGRKRAANSNTDTLKAKASLPIKNQVHPSNMGIPTRYTIEIPSVDLISACTEPIMNNISNLTQPPLNTDANLTTMRTNTPKAKTVTISPYIDVAQGSISKNGNLQPTAMYINDDGAQTALVEAPQGEVNINMNKDSVQIPLIVDEQVNLSLNINKAPVKTTMLNTAPNLASMDMTTTAEILQTGTFIQPTNNNTNRQIAVTLCNNNNYRGQTDATPTPKTLVQAILNADEVNLSTTSTAIEKISHNIENNAVLTSAAINAETDSIQGIANSISKTVNHRIETKVEVIKQMSDFSTLSIEYLQDILNNAQQIPTKTAENSLPNQKTSRDSRQTENDLENLLSLITTGLPLSPKKTKVDDQARTNAKHVVDVGKTIQGGNNNDRLKESTETLMQRKNVKSNTVRTEAATGKNPATQNRNTNEYRDSQDNKILEKHRKTPRENDDQSGDIATRATEEIINNIRNTLKKNCSSNEEELPQVKIPGRKQKEMITEEKKTISKPHQPYAEKCEYICSVCSAIFSYSSSCLSHMTEDHSIENPKPVQRIFRLCPFCGSYYMRQSYTTHIKTAHKDKFNEKVDLKVK